MPRMALLFGMLFVPGFAFSQTTSPPDDELDRILASIAEQSPRNLQSAELIDALSALALRLQADGEHARAEHVLKRALEFVRINYGLSALEQVPLLRQSIDNEKARGGYAAAWRLEQALLNLIRSHPTDLVTAAVLREIGDERIDVLGRYLEGELPPEIVLGCYYGSAGVPFRRCSAGSKGAAVRHLLQEASQHYEDAIEVLLRNEAHPSAELQALESKLLRANYLYGSQLDPPGRYEKGKQSLERLAAYASETTGAVTEVELLVQVADWDLMYSNNAAALNAYQHAYDRVVQEGLGPDAIKRLFSPDPPVALPSFLPNPLVSQMTPQTRGFIDVSFEITRFGISRRIKILDDANATEADKDRLAKTIANRRFRPRMEAGRFGASRVMLRYFLSDE